MIGSWRRDDLSARWSRRICLWTLTLSVPLAGVLALLGQPWQALSVLLGAALGALNFLSLTRAALRVLREAEAEPTTTAAREGRFAPLLAALRWPATALATVAVLWYMPGRPEGLVTGVLLALAALTAAALQGARELQHDRPADPEHDPPD